MTGILRQLKWESLKKRRKDNRLILLHKSLTGKASVPTDDLIPKTRCCRNQHSMAFQTPMANTDLYKGSFFPQTIRDWIALPDSLISSAEDAEDCVAKFTSLVKAWDSFLTHRSWWVIVVSTWWGFISRNYVVWPIFFLTNVFIALKGTHFWILFTSKLSWSWSWWLRRGKSNLAEFKLLPISVFYMFHKDSIYNKPAMYALDTVKYWPFRPFKDNLLQSGGFDRAPFRTLSIFYVFPSYLQVSKWF